MSTGNCQDWKRHKRECPLLASGIDKQVEFPLTVQAVVFPMEGGPPLILNLPYKLVENGDYPLHQLDLRPVLGRAIPSRTRIDIAGFKVGPPLGHRTEGGRGYRWCDQLVAVRHVNKEERLQQSQDVTPEDV
ncbi:hypothetical protein V8D89_014451 [Ganoderma adspersum]